MSKTLPTPLDVKLMNMMAAILFMAFALMVLAALLGWLARHPIFALRGIAVTGEVTHNNAVTLRANVTPRLRGTFFTIDLTSARQVFESVPWVRKAVVRREFPNRLRVLLEEHQTVAFWGPESESRLLNNFGEVFEANVGEVDQDVLPRLNGPDGQAPQVLAMYRVLAPHFDAMEMSIEQLEMTARGGWRAHLDSGATLELGAGTQEEVLARVQRFLKTLTQVVSRYGRTPEALETADLRHQDGYAIRLRGVSTVALDKEKKSGNKNNRAN